MHDRLLSREKIKKGLKSLSYLVLFASALAFCWQNFVEHLRGSTGFSVTEEPITLRDLPTLTFCWDIENGRDNLPVVYGEDFYVNATVSDHDKETITISENEGTQALFELQLQISELKQFWKPYWQCFKISMTWNGTNSRDVATFRMTLGFYHSNKDSDRFERGHRLIDHANVLVTSEQNSYGMAGGRWFDGEDGGFERRKYIGDGDELTLIEVMEYKHLHSSCSQDSYYECLAKELINYNSAHIESNTSVCSIKKLCSPFSLPVIANYHIPICKNEFERLCFTRVISRQMSNQDNHCRRLCNVKEYNFKTASQRQYAPDSDQSKAFGITLNFATPHSTRDLRSLRPFKTVKTEYEIVTFMSLVGTVGGTLGMIVGFSFIAIYRKLIYLLIKTLTFIIPAKLQIKCNSTLSTKGSATRSLEIALYICLLCLGVAFTWQTLNRYMMNNVSYSEKRVPVKLKDLPTWTICFELDKVSSTFKKLTYGKNFYVTAKVFENEDKVVTLLENIGINILYNLTIRLNEVQQTWIPNWQCYKISSTWEGNRTIKLHKFGVQLAFYYKEDDLHTAKYLNFANVYATSEQNSYGISGGGRWFDGNVVQHRISKDPIGRLWIDNELTISEVTEFEQLDGTCVHKSYYEFLAENLKSFDLNSLSRMNGSKCTPKKICFPYSLPTLGDDSFPICQSETDRACFENVLLDIESNHARFWKKHCFVQEYLLNPKHKIDPSKFSSNRSNPLVLTYRFDKPIASKDLTSMRALKTVKIEYKIISELELIGIVGGILAMLVGFSLLGAFEWCLSKFFHFLSLITKSKTEVDTDSLSSKTKLGLLMKMLLYLGLLICALKFCNKSIKEYKKGSTSYSVSKQQISLKDLPTLIICWPVGEVYGKNVSKEIYGEDFTIDVKVIEKQEKTVTLSEHESIPTILGLSIKLSEFIQTWKPPNSPYTTQCYKMSTVWNNIGSMDPNIFKMTIIFKHGTRQKAESYIFVSSEENSYGLATGRWFDGKDSGTFGHNWELMYGYDWCDIQIHGVTEYKKIQTTCSHDSYYQCLSGILQHVDYAKHSNKTVNGLRCPFDKFCYPSSLPMAEGNKVPICKTEHDRICYQKVLLEILSDEKTFCERRCKVIEYNFEMDCTSKTASANTSIISYQFRLPSASRDVRLTKPFKVVKNEYLIVNLISLVGTVGGTVGVFVGFSLIGTSEWFLRCVLLLLARFK